MLINIWVYKFDLNSNISAHISIIAMNLGTLSFKWDIIFYAALVISAFACIDATNIDRKVHIVYMGDKPKNVLQAVEPLHKRMLEEVVGSESSELLIHSYKRSFNAFAAKLSDAEAIKMASMSQVVSVFPSKTRELHTTESWNFIGFPETSNRSTNESDIIIGMLDTGIWPETESFNDEGLGPPPSKWKGSCQALSCNNKIIGAKYYNLGKNPTDKYPNSPRDSEGHGSHTSSIAAGRVVSGMSLYDLAEGRGRGGVPSARLAVYKVCWLLGCTDADILAAFDDAIADGVDILSVSIGDSDESDPCDYFNDSIAIGAFHAMKNGVLTSTSAGNFGPRPYSLSNYSPWSLTVAANTINRRFVAYVTLGNGRTYEGAAINTFDMSDKIYSLVYGGDTIAASYDGSTSRFTFVYGGDAPAAGYDVSISSWNSTFGAPRNLTAAGFSKRKSGAVCLVNPPSSLTMNLPAIMSDKMYPLVYGGDAPAAGYNGSTSRYCYEGSLNPTIVKGTIVLCDKLTNASSGPLLAGAAGLIIRSEESPGLPDGAKSFPLPATVVNMYDGADIFHYIRKTSNPTASIQKSQVVANPAAPYVASFSSRGPNPITADILKPDLTAPGVDILAAWSPVASMSIYKGDTRSVSYNIISGTSMACPHVSGAAAYVKSFNPDWSPAAIKSALMTTAYSMSSSSNVDAEFAYGAGQLNPTAAVKPGLVYEAGESDYISMLCGQGYSTKIIQLVTGDNSSCTADNNGTVWDLNYPSFTFSTKLGSEFSMSFKRTITNVGDATSLYTATITSPEEVKVSIEPGTFQFKSLMEKQTYTLTVEGVITGAMVSASLLLTDGVYYVRSPIVVYANGNGHMGVHRAIM